MRELPPRHKAWIRQLCRGIHPKTICAEAGISSKWLHAVARMPEGKAWQEECHREREMELFGRSAT